MLSSNTFNTPTICSVLCGSIFLCGSPVFVRSRFGRLDIDCFRHCQRVSASRLETFPNYRACTQVRGLVVNLRHHEDPSRRQTVQGKGQTVTHASGHFNLFHELEENKQKATGATISFLLLSSFGLTTLDNQDLLPNAPMTFLAAGTVLTARLQDGNCSNDAAWRSLSVQPYQPPKSSLSNPS